MPTRKEDENLHNEESVRADARLVRDGLEAIQNILNPLDLALAEKNAVQETKAASLLRDKFTTCKYVYETIQPDEEKCPQTLRHVAEEEFGQKLSTDLELYIAIPKYLLESEGSNASYPIKLAIRFHGGGGTTGKPLYDPFSYLAHVEYTLETPGMIILEPSYELMPETFNIHGNIANMWKWLYDHLQSKLEAIRSEFVVDWGSVYLFGGSFGGEVAMLAWLNSACHDNKPSDLHIRLLAAHAPTMKNYSRLPGQYIGTYISQERADKDSKDICDLLEGMPYRKARAEDDRCMFGGPVFSISGRFEKLRNGKSTLEILEETSRCPDARTRLFFTHGELDLHVNPKDTEDTVGILRKKWGCDILFKLQKGKDHSWDCNEPLDKEFRDFLNGS